MSPEVGCLCEITKFGPQARKSLRLLLGYNGVKDVIGNIVKLTCANVMDEMEGVMLLTKRISR